MRTVTQRVQHASVTIDGQLKSKIGKGLLVLVGIEDKDTQEDIEWLAKKITNLRIFDDENGVMNRSVIEAGGEIMVVRWHTAGQENGEAVLFQAQVGRMGLEVGDDGGPVGTVGRGIHVSAIEERSYGCCIQVEDGASFLKFDVLLDVQRTERLHIANAVMCSVDTFS